MGNAFDTISARYQSYLTFTHTTWTKQQVLNNHIFNNCIEESRTPSSLMGFKITQVSVQPKSILQMLLNVQPSLQNQFLLNILSGLRRWCPTTYSTSSTNRRWILKLPRICCQTLITAAFIQELRALAFERFRFHFLHYVNSIL